MIVYQSTKQGFRDDVFSNEIDKKILEAYKIHLYNRQNEMRAV